MSDFCARYIVVGAGCFGATMAERIASVLNERVLVLEKRCHVGGNSYSEVEARTGIECHLYGSHIFHTANRRVWDYVNRFTAFNNYRHNVLSEYQGRIFQMPFNLSTINDYYGVSMRPAQARAFLQQEAARENIERQENLEDKAIAAVGRRLYEAFIRGYTFKHWGVDPRLLPPDIIARIPVRYDYRSAYFDDPFQGIPVEGYGALFMRMLSHPNIEVRTSVDYFDCRTCIPENSTLIFSGPLDRFFDYKYGELGWRSVVFDKEVRSEDDYQGTAVMNHADASTHYTRTHEFKHYTPERRATTNGTVLYREYARATTTGDDPSYPMGTIADKTKVELYKQEGRMKRPRVIFGGRLGSYRYINMDAAILDGLETFDKEIQRVDRETRP